MPLPPYIQEASRESFQPLVLGNSMKGLVLAYYWSPRAGPCQVLRPRLLALAEAWGGRFLLVLVDTDQLGGLAREQGITSVPTVKFYLGGEVVHTIHGAEPDSTFRAALGRFLAQEDDRVRQEALRAHQAGDTETAITLLARAATERPEDLGIAADLAKLLTLSGQPGQALALLTALPADAKKDGRVAPLLAHLQLREAAEQDLPPGEADDAPAARLGRAARALLADDLEAALDGLLGLALTHPEFRDDLGRRGLLALFQMLGPEHELTRRYRARLAAGAH